MLFEIILSVIFIFLVILCAFVFLSLEHRVVYRNLKRKHVVVTGGSSGIGKAAAMEAAIQGAHVTVIGRNIGQLEATVKEIKDSCPGGNEQKIQYLSLDVTSSYYTIEKSFSALEAEIGPIFMLLNSAGMCICGQFSDMKPDDIKKMVDLNYFGTAYPTRYVLSGMKARKEGRIVFVASEAALIGIYGLSAYSASKWALRGLAEAVFMELLGTGVNLTLAFPPDTDTPGLKTEDLTKPKETKLISGAGGLQDPKDVGRKIIKDAMHGRSYSVFGTTGHILTLLNCSAVDSITQVLMQIFTMGFLRAVMVPIQLSFFKIVRDGLKEKSQKNKIN